MTAEKKSKAKPQKNDHDQRQGDRTAEPSIEQPDDLKWHERAAFQVVFEQATDGDGGTIWHTCGYHEESDTRAIWPGIAGEPLLRWMREHADLPELGGRSEHPRQAASPARPDRSAAAHAAGLQIQIGELELSEALAEREVSGAEASRQLSAQVHFEILGDGAQSHAAGAASYTLELLACDQATERSLILASARGELQPGTLDYSELVMFEFPPVGDYQLLATVLLPQPQIASTAVGPVLHVIP